MIQLLMAVCCAAVAMFGAIAGVRYEERVCRGKTDCPEEQYFNESMLCACCGALLVGCILGFCLGGCCTWRGVVICLVAMLPASAIITRVGMWLLPLLPDVVEWVRWLFACVLDAGADILWWFHKRFGRGRKKQAADPALK
jgi:hypothetical protein